MEKTLALLNEYFQLNNLKSFCEFYGESYEFTRQVLIGKKPVTEKFIHNMMIHITSHQARQERIFKEL